MRGTTLTLSHRPTTVLVAKLAEHLCGARTMTTKLAMFDSPVTSRKNFVLMWEQQPGATYAARASPNFAALSCSVYAGIVGGEADNNIVELAKVGTNDFQLNRTPPPSSPPPRRALRAFSARAHGAVPCFQTVKDTLSPFQVFGIALSSICAEK